VHPEGLGKFKKITLSGIEPATFGFVALCLNTYATTETADEQNWKHDFIQSNIN
jgi:hypothetical protein